MKVNFQYLGKSFEFQSEELLIYILFIDVRKMKGEDDLLVLFRYTTGGREILSQIKTGDVVRSAKLVEGEDRLVLPPKET